MDNTAYNIAASQVLRDLGIANVDPEWSGCDDVWEAFEKMANEGATVIVKIDGQRTSPSDTGRYTILVSGGPLNDDYFRLDTPSLEEGLARAILHYAERCWK